MLNNGDSRYFEESISINRLKALLDSRAAQNSNSIAAIRDKLQGMKWLLAMISKGRDVSQFYPDVVKIISVKSVELKKLVYFYLMHYTDHNSTCRELALLSINSFQKDLVDINALIRALALRTMTSIRAHDIAHLQLMAAQKCSTDCSLYVRKIAAHALPKIYSLDPSTESDHIVLLQKFLSDSFVVVGSAMFAFSEICPNEWSIIHQIFRRLCASIVDMDDWSQIFAISVLMRYARRFFCRPVTQATRDASQYLTRSFETEIFVPVDYDEKKRINVEQRLSASNHEPYHPIEHMPKPIRQLPTNEELQAFYDSDPEPASANNSKVTEKTRGIDLLNAWEENPLSGEKMESSRKLVSTNDKAEIDIDSQNRNGYVEFIDRSHDQVKIPKKMPSISSGVDAGEGESSPSHSGSTMEPDHRLLLKSCLPLLHSRNSGVVLSTVSLLWHCGRKSTAAMQSCAGALMRLVRSNREVQYVVLNAIIPMILESPWCFHPHIRGFFVDAVQDAQFVRHLKVDILVLLATEENVHLILREFEVYVAHPNKKFVQYVIRALGRVVSKLPSLICQAIGGLMTLMTSPDEDVATEAVLVARLMLQQHPEHTEIVQHLVGMLDRTVNRPDARASVIWVATEFAEHISNSVPEILRQLVVTFEQESLEVKMQTLNLAVRLYLLYENGNFNGKFGALRARKVSEQVKKLMTYAFELAKFDLDYDLRDRVRYLEAAVFVNSDHNLGHNATALKILTAPKPCPTFSTVESEYAIDMDAKFAIDSLAHCIGYALSGYQVLLDWPTKIPNPGVRDTKPKEVVSSSNLLGEQARKFFEEKADSVHNRSESSSSSETGFSSGSSDDGDCSSKSASSDSESSFDSSSDSGSEPSSSHLDFSPQEVPESESSNKRPASKPSRNLLNFLEDDDHGSKEEGFQLERHNNPSCNDKRSSTRTTVLTPEDLQNQAILLLSNLSSDGLRVEVAFARKSATSSNGMNTLLMFLTNCRSQPLSSVRITAIKLVEKQSMVSFDPVATIAPDETVKVEIQIGFNGKPNLPVRFSFATDRGVFPVVLDAPCGELVVPFSALMRDDLFIETKRLLSGMHESKKNISESSKLGDFFLTVGYESRKSILKHAANLEFALVVNPDGREEIRGAGVKLNDHTVKVLLVQEDRSLSILCDDSLFGQLLLDEIYNKLELQLNDTTPQDIAKSM